MGREQVLSGGLFAVGSVMIAIASGAGLVAAYRFDVVAVYLYLAVFLVGYKLAQLGLNDPHALASLNPHSRLLQMRWADRISILGGSGFMGLGFVLLTQGIAGQQFLFSLASAIIMGSGYVLAHWGMNNTLV